MEMQSHYSFVLSLPLRIILSILRSSREFSFAFIDNVNLCESNAMQIFELIFCNSER